MNFAEYHERLQALSHQLTKDARFRAVIDIYPPFSEADFADLAQSITGRGIPNFQIWPGFKDFYEKLDGFRLQWQYLDDGPAIKTGSAQIALLPAIYLPEDAPADSVTRIYSEPRILDLVGPDDHVALRLNQGTQQPDLMYFAEATRQYHPLALDFESYLNMLLEARAMYGWQRFFVDSDFPVSGAQASEFRDSLKLLFPEVNTNLFNAPEER